MTIQVECNYIALNSYLRMPESTNIKKVHNLHSQSGCKEYLFI